MKEKTIQLSDDKFQDLRFTIVKNSVRSAITCADAHRIALDKNLDPSVVGEAIDASEIRIVQCDLGLFGYNTATNKMVKPAESVPDEIQKVIKEKLDTSGKLNCLLAWNIADEFNISRLDIANICEKLKIKINLCQLNAF